jgi:intracellular septation protein A
MDTLKYFVLALRPLLVDLLSTIVFAVLYAVTGNLTLGIALGMATGVGQIAFLKIRGLKIEIMQWASLGLVVVLGSASLLTQNPHFAMLKPTVAGIAIGCVMLNPGWQMRYFPQIVRDNVSPRELRAWGYIWAAMVFALAGANLYVAYELGRTAWAWFTSVVPMTAQLGLFAVQFVSIRQSVARNIRGRMAQAPAE